MRDEAKKIIAALRSGRFFLSVHAARRMRQRSITVGDIQACGRTFSSCRFQAGCCAFRVDGTDMDGLPLTVICGIDKAVIVVTVFQGRTV